MKVVLDTRSGRRPQVEADIEAVRLEDKLQGPRALLGEVHHLVQGIGRERLQIGQMSVGRHHDVPVVVGEGVQDHEGVGAAPHDVGGSVVSGQGFVAEDASRRLLLGDVLQPPRRPQPFHACSFPRSRSR